MKRGATIGSYLATVIVLILVCFSATPATAHGVHLHTAAASSVQSALIDDSLAGAAIHVVEVAAFETTPSQAQDGRPQPCEEPCCAGHGGGCFCGYVARDGGSFLTPRSASRDRPPGHDRSRPSRSGEAPTEPPRLFA